MPQASALDEFRELVRTRFQKVIATYGLDFVTGESGSGGMNLLQILASPAIQIKFVKELDHVGISLGGLGAARTWTDDRDGVTEWFPEATLVGYEDHRSPGQSFRPASFAKTQGPDPDVYIAYWGEMLDKYLPRLLPAFSPAPPPGWWDGYRAFTA